MKKVKCEFDWVELMYLKDKVSLRKMQEEKMLEKSKERNDEIDIAIYERDIKRSEALLEKIERYLNSV